jgi:hypothetical protein
MKLGLICRGVAPATDMATAEAALLHHTRATTGAHTATKVHFMTFSIIRLKMVCYASIGGAAQ